MKPMLTEMLWLDEHNTISLSELSEVSGLTPDDLNELVSYGAIAPLESGTPQLMFNARCVITAKTALRLRTDFELDMHAVALAVTLIERVQELESRLRELGAKFPRRVI